MSSPPGSSPKPDLKIRKAPYVLDDEGNPVLGPDGKPIEKIWTEKEGVGIGTEGAAPEQGWTTPVVNLSLGNKKGGITRRKRHSKKTKKVKKQKRKSVQRKH